MLRLTINGLLRRLASTRLTLLWMLLLAIGAGLSYDNPVETSIWVLIIPMLLLAVNLIAAIISNPRINRRGGLLVFHLGLLGIVVLAAIGRLTYMEGSVEIVTGNEFSRDAFNEMRHGPLNSGDTLDQIRFVQGPYTVEYRAQMMRGLTHSYVAIPDGKDGWREVVVGDDRPLVIDGHRFYTTFNKGFAPILTWNGDNGQVETGAVHMPSYPLFDFKQSNNWVPEGGKEIKFWLQLETGLTKDSAWVLDGRKSTGTLVVNVAGERTELQPGESVKMPGGELKYERLTTWMGYKLFYDPTLHWMFVTSIIAVLGLGAHFWRKLAAEPLKLDEVGSESSRHKDATVAPRTLGAHRRLV